MRILPEKAHASTQQPIKNFRVFLCFFVVKKWILGASPRLALQAVFNQGSHRCAHHFSSGSLP
ncbi:MAG: hypothetical protein PHY82_09330, partial [Lentisphaeria bacterium]|nr:hypothetical protein [Lentisphaeria bacterium]